VRLWDVASGKEIRAFTGDQDLVLSVAFAPDGKTLASGNWDSSILVWRIFGVPGGSDLEPAELQAFWTDLGGSDATRAYRAIYALVAVPHQSVPFLREELLLRGRAPDPRHIAQLIADLDSDMFQARQKADQELEKLGGWAEPALRKTLDDKPSLELGRR